MIYNDLSDDEAMKRIREHPEFEDYPNFEREVIHAPSLLQWLDAFGDMNLAVNCQMLPHDLPTEVVKEISEYDVYHEWQGEVRRSECAVGGEELYEFDFRYDWVTIDEYGRDLSQRIEYVSDHSGYYWDSSGENHLMCPHCRSQPDNFPVKMNNHYGVKMFYGDLDEWYPFSYAGSVIRWDGEYNMDNPKCCSKNIRDLDGNLVSPREIAEAFSFGNVRQMEELIERLGYIEITPYDVELKTPGIRRTYRYARDVLEKWASVDSTSKRPTHPDFNFTYFIEDGEYLYCPEEHRDTVMNELEDQVLFESGAVEKLKEHRRSKEANT